MITWSNGSVSYSAVVRLPPNAEPPAKLPSIHPQRRQLRGPHCLKSRARRFGLARRWLACMSSPLPQRQMAFLTGTRALASGARSRHPRELALVRARVWTSCSTCSSSSTYPRGRSPLAEGLEAKRLCPHGCPTVWER